MGLFASALRLSQMAAPSSVNSGELALYAKSDGLLYTKNSAGSESALGGGGGDVVKLFQIVVNNTTTTSVVLNSIPQTYTSLRLVVSGGLPTSVVPITMACSGMTFATTYQQMSGTTSSVAAGNNNEVGYVGTGAPYPFSLDCLIPGYASTAFGKSYISNAVWGASTPASLGRRHYVGSSLAATAAAITSMTISTPSAVPFVTGSTFTLYGLK